MCDLFSVRCGESNPFFQGICVNGIISDSDCSFAYQLPTLILLSVLILILIFWSLLRKINQFHIYIYLIKWFKRYFGIWLLSQYHQLKSYLLFLRINNLCWLINVINFSQGISIQEKREYLAWKSRLSNLIPSKSNCA